MNTRMRTDPDREDSVSISSARDSSPHPAEGTDVFLHYFMSVLIGMEPPAVRQMYDELTNRFGGRHCSSQICRMMAELVRGRLASESPRVLS